MWHHAFVIEAETESGIARAQAWVVSELGISVEGTPDVITLRYGLFSVADARRVADMAAQAPFEGGFKVLIIAADRLYHEAQNALLKLFEEPPKGTYLFLVVPTLGGIVSTLLSRVVRLEVKQDNLAPRVSEGAKAFIEANREKRSALIKKLTTGKDEEERREKRDEALEIVRGIELAAYAALREKKYTGSTELLSELSALQEYLHDRSAPVKMILEHLAIVTPRELSAYV